MSETTGFVNPAVAGSPSSTQSNIDVDISLGALPFEQEMIELAIEFTTSELTVQVATPEDLIIIKAVAHRPKTGASLLTSVPEVS